MKILPLSLLLLLPFSFSACNFDSLNNSFTYPSYSGLSFSDSDDTWAYSSSNDIHVLNENSATLSISGNLGGKTLYVADVNISNIKIDKEYVKYINSSSFRGLQEESTLQSEEDAMALDEDFLLPDESYRHFIGYDFEPDPEEFLSGRAALSDSYSVTPLSYKVGSTHKDMQVCRNANDTQSRVSTRATLWASNDTCNVWVVDDDSYLNSDSKKQEMAERFADAFQAFYPVVTNVFGNESDSIYCAWRGGQYTTGAMADYSDTGTKINILIYDLFNDGENGNVLGLFSSGDYYISSFFSSSNVGKYFYIDSYFATAEKTKNSIFSTLVHEFQHMINYGVKKIEKGLSSDTNFNEMLSMLCEDMMQQFLTDSGFTIKDDDSPKGRFARFMIQYFNCGIRNYDETALSYANAYAFGSWLCRQYGGAALVKEMMSNNYTNNSCIFEAVNKVNDTKFTFDDLFTHFIKACYGKDSTFTFNRNAAQTVSYSSGSTTYRYPMKAIDLWSKKDDSIYNLSNLSLSSGISAKNYLQTNYGSYLASAYNFLGPAVFKYSSYKTLQPVYGVLLKRVGVFSAGTTSYNLKFSSSSGYTRDGMKVVLYIN